MALFRAMGWGVVSFAFAACGGASSSNPFNGTDGGTGDEGGIEASSGGAASGGTSSGATSSGGASGGATSSGGSTSGASSGSASSSGANSSGASSSGASSGGPRDASSDGPMDAPGAQCPDLRGSYSITPVQGQGCGAAFSASAPQCIRQQSCDITLSTKPLDGGDTALSGMTTIGSDGSFSGAGITEGTLNRTGCVGTWGMGSGSLTIDCGGVDSGQACLLTLTRISNACP